MVDVAVEMKESVSEVLLIVRREEFNLADQEWETSGVQLATLSFFEIDRVVLWLQVCVYFKDVPSIISNQKQTRSVYLFQQHCKRAQK